ERQRIAVILHDDLQQLLATALMQVGALSDISPSDEITKNVVLILKESIKKTRHLSQDLTPLHSSGLLAAIEWLTHRMKERFGLQVDLETENAELSDTSAMKVFLFRAVQELLFNTVKHAGVKSAHVSFSISNG